MNLILIGTQLAVVVLAVYTLRLARKVNDIDEEVDEMDSDVRDTFAAVGDHIGELIVRADRVEVQLGGAENSQAQAQGAEVFAILNEAQEWMENNRPLGIQEVDWAAANESPVVPVVKGFVGFPQDYDPTYHFGGQQRLPKLGDTESSGG